MKLVRFFFACSAVIFLAVNPTAAFQEQPSLELNPRAEPAAGAESTAAESKQRFLPEEAPDGLSEDEFLNLAPKWEEWGSSTAQLIVRLYEDEELTDADRTELIGKLRERMKTMDDAIGNPKYHLIHSQLRALRQRLGRRLDLIDSVILGMKNVPGDDVREKVFDVLTAIEGFESDSRTTSVDGFRKAYNALRNSYPAVGGPLSAVVIQHYYNYNLHVAIPEDLIVPLLRDTRTESGIVDDCVLGAKVDGCQTTRATVSVDIKPNQNGATLRFHLRGNTRTNTRGRKKPAVIFTEGNHSFDAHKDVYFDGTHLTTGHTAAFVDANNRTLGAKTEYDWVPIVGWFGMVRGIAVKEAGKKRAESEAISEQKLREQLVPKFDDEIGSRISKANAELATSFGKLQNAKLYPDNINTRSSETHIAMSTRTVGRGQIGGSPLDHVVVPHQGIAMQIHESLVNNMLDQLDLNGRSLNEEQLVAHVESVLTNILGRPVNFPDPQPEPADESEDDLADEDDEEEEEPEEPPTFTFDATDPLRVEFESDHINLILRTGLEQGDKKVPLQEVKIPIKYRLKRKHIILEADSPQINAVKPASRLQQISRAAQLRRILEKRLPRREINTAFEAKIDEKKSVHMAANLLEAADGWMTIVIGRD